MDATCSLGNAPSCHASQGFPQSQKRGETLHPAGYSQAQSAGHECPPTCAALQYRSQQLGPSGSDEHSLDATSYHLPNSPSSRPSSNCGTAACPDTSLQVAKAAKGASICSPRQSASQLVANTTTAAAAATRELPNSPSPNSASEPLVHLHIQSPPPAATAATHHSTHGSPAPWPQQHTWAATADAGTATAAPILSPHHSQDQIQRRRSGVAVAAALAAVPGPGLASSRAAPAAPAQAYHQSHLHQQFVALPAGRQFTPAAVTVGADCSDPMHTDSTDEGTGCSGVAPPHAAAAAATCEAATAAPAAAAEAPAAANAEATAAAAGALDADTAGALFRVNSLAMSDPEVDLLDALLKGNSDDADDGEADGGTGAVDGGFLGAEGAGVGGVEGAGSGPVGAFGSARAVRPTSFGGAIGPFAEASLQPTLSDYSGRASPGELEDDAVLLAGLEAAADQLEADSAVAAAAAAASVAAAGEPAPDDMGRSMGAAGGGDGAAAAPQLPHAHLQALHHQPHLLNAYSEPLPFSAPLPHHLALHPNAPGSLAPGPAAAPVPATAAPAAAAPPSFAAASPGHAMSPGPVPPAPRMMRPHAAALNTAAASPPAPSPGSPCMGGATVGSSSPPHLQHQSSAHARTPHRLSRTVATAEEHGLLPPAHSAPAANGGNPHPPPPMPATGAVSSGDACSPMHVDVGASMEPRVGSCHSFGACGGSSGGGGGTQCGGGSGSTARATAAQAGCDHHSSGGGGGHGGSTSGADGGATSADDAGPHLQALQAARAPGQHASPFDIRGKRVRPQDAPAPTSLAPGPAPPPPTAATIGAAAAAKGFGRPSSPSSHSHSVGDPMSISTAAADPSGGGYPHPHQAYAPYHPAYVMYPPPGPYGMPYDPYYPYGYPHPHHHPGYPETAPPPHGASDPYGGGGHPHPAGGPYDMAAAAGGPRAPMHYPGFMVPRQRLYRRFMSGLRGRDAAVPPELATSGALPAAAQAPAGAAEGAASAGAGGSGPWLMSMGSAPVSSAAASAAVAAADVAAVGQLSNRHGDAARLRAASAAAAASAAGVSKEASVLAATEADGMQAARECHDIFAGDDVALPLPRSTVDGIRQELRAVTQELIQRRMGAAAAVVACGGTAVPEGPGTGATQGPFLQPRTSLPVLEATSSVPSRPPGAPAQLGSTSCVSAPPGHSSHPHTSVLHKRPSTGPDGSSAFSPPRIRPAPSAPAANVFAAAFGHAGAAAPLPISGPDAGVSRSTGGAATCSTAVPASMQPPLLYTSDLRGASQPPLGSPPAMRQLFPGPAGPGASAFGVRPSSASAPLAGPRPTMSGSTASVCHSASGAHPLPPMPTVAAQRMEEGRSAHQQPQQVQAQAAQSQHPHLQQLHRPQSHPHQQHQLQPQQHATNLPQGSSAAAPMANSGAYQVGQQGSVAAEAEGEVEGGEEVHGPDTATAMWIHRNSTTNGGTSAGGVGGSSAAVTGAAQPPSARVAAAGPGPGAPAAAGYYPPPPGPYDYHGYGAYYPPPPHAVYGSRPGYGMYPPPTYGVPPPGSYRGGMYGMHPPPPTYGPTAWPDYCMPLPAGSGAPPPGAPRS